MAVEIEAAGEEPWRASGAVCMGVLPPESCRLSPQTYPPLLECPGAPIVPGVRLPDTG